MRELDVGLFRWINGWPDSLAPFFHFLSEGNKAWPVRIGFIILLAGLLAWNGRSRTAAMLAVLAWVAANELTDALKLAFGVPRPCVELDGVKLYVAKLTSPGTASAHAANMAAVGFVLSLMLGRWWWMWMALALLVGLSRVYVGVHYPSQVLLGWAAGMFVGWMAVRSWRAWERLRRARSANNHAME